MKKRHAAIIFLILLIVAGIMFLAFRKKAMSKTAQRSYSTYLTRKENFEKIVEADGKVEARDTKLIYADSELKVDKLYYQEGDYVKKGEVIMTFDPEDKNKVMRKLKKEEITLKKLERDLKNAKELLDIGGGSKIDMEDIQYSIEESILTIEEYKEEISKMLDDIKSPFDGTIISMIAEENYRVNTESELFEITDLSDIIIVADVPEYSIKGLAVGQKARIYADAYDEFITGSISEISTLSTETNSESSSSSSNSAEAYVEVKINLDKNPEELRPGFNADIEIIPFVSENTISIPRSAVLGNGGQYYVFEIKPDNSIKKLSISLGKSNSNMVEALDIGENIIIVRDPDQSLKDGDKIKVKSSEENSSKKKPREGA